MSMHSLFTHCSLELLSYLMHLGHDEVVAGLLIGLLSYASGESVGQLREASANNRAQSVHI